MNINSKLALMICSKFNYTLYEITQKLVISLDITVSSSYRIIDSLFKNGYISKTLNNESVVLIITQKGKKLIEQIKEV
jgi:predicted transcriptional regulator